MRPMHFPRPVRRGTAVAGTLLMTMPIAGAVALPATAGAAASTAATVPAHLHSHQVGYGREVVLSGSLGSALAGHRLALEYESAGGSSWRTVARTTVSRTGHYRLAAPLHRTGTVRVVDVSTAPAASAAAAPQRVKVAAALRVPHRAFASMSGHSVTVHGHMLPGVAGRVVRLQAGRGHGWRTVATTSTGRGGTFTFRYTPRGGPAGLRVRFAGDGQNASASAAAGTIAQYFASTSSWYNDGGMTGCGFHATYGVANKSLPCGTKVRFVYGGRSVVATVDDRGPYVGGRTWDLNQNTAAALGFGGVGTVWASY